MAKTKVLIADDNPDLLIGLEIQLKNEGYEVLMCKDADLAVAHAQKYHPDVMLIDIWMGSGSKMILNNKENGLAVVERINDMRSTRGTPVIFITGANSAELDMRAQKVGAFGLIHKPINFPELVKMIQLAKRSRADGGVAAGIVGDAGRFAGAQVDICKGSL